MQIQHELPLIASMGSPKDEPLDAVREMTFEQCVRLAFEKGTSRYPMKMVGRLAGIHAPHVSDVVMGKRPLKAEKVDVVCWLTGCNAPRQWLDLQREQLQQQAEAQAKALVWEQFKRMTA